MRTGEEPVDGFAIGAFGIGLRGFEEGVDLGGRRRQADEIEADAAELRFEFRPRRRSELLVGQRLADEGVDRMGGAVDLRRRDFSGGSNAQCFAYSAPDSIQRLRISFCAAVSFLPDFGGGICSSGSAWMRRISSLLSGFFGTIAFSPLGSSAMAPARSSSRRSAWRASLSKPWQAKQFSARIGNTSRRN